MSTTENTTDATRTTLVPGLAAAVLAAVGNVAIYGAAKGVGIDIETGSGSDVMAIPTVAPIVATLITVGLAAVVAWAIVRSRPQARRPLALAGFVVAVVSCAAPLTMATELSGGLALSLMHLFAGAAWLQALSRRA